MAETNSFKSMSRGGIIKRTDTGMYIRYADIHVRDGFNVRDLTDPDMADDNASLDAHIAAGGHVPPLEVVAHPDSGVEIIEGHRRHASYGRRIDAGQTIEWIRIDPFVGNDRAQAARILTSSEGRQLKPLERAEGYRKLAAFGMSSEEIARFVHKTRQHVDQYLVLSAAPNDLHQAVKKGEISATDATKLARKGDQAAKEGLAKGREAAKAAGKTKITAGVMKPWTPPAKVVASVITALESFLESVPKGERVTMESNDTGKELVQVNAKELHDVFKAFNEIVAACVAADEKQRAKAAKAAQGALPGTDGG